MVGIFGFKIKINFSGATFRNVTCNLIVLAVEIGLRFFFQTQERTLVR